jgi:hypothetical protein
MSKRGRTGQVVVEEKKFMQVDEIAEFGGN